MIRLAGAPLHVLASYEDHDFRTNPTVVSAPPKLSGPLKKSRMVKVDQFYPPHALPSFHCRMLLYPVIEGDMLYTWVSLS
jgi:hypothetical protein